MALAATLQAATLKGRITDADSGVPLMGAAIVITGTAHGTVTDFDGNYQIDNIPAGQVEFSVSYVSYRTHQFAAQFATAADVVLMDIALQSDDKQIGEVQVVARKNMENENLLLQERKAASVAIENMGAKEMQIKGVSNVQDGVKKLSGISIASSGQLIVRGLGDRYSTTTLNGLPIASPNPDNKLIPLDLFPASTVKNITVSKVYQASAFADYSGAHVDIGTKENTGKNFLSLSANVGGQAGTVGGDVWNMHRGKLLWGNNGLGQNVVDMSKSDFRSYVLSHDVFGGSTFSVRRRTAVPDYGLGVSTGRNIDWGTATLSLLAAGSANADLRKSENAFVRTLNDLGDDLNHFTYDSYTEQLESAALATAALSLDAANRMAYTIFYARNAVDNYSLRRGTDYESHRLTGSNSVTHIYSLLNQQIMGHHAPTERLEVDWSGSYSTTQSDEPDRRQVMFVDTDGGLRLFKLNQQETMRYFGTLDENELVGGLKVQYSLGENAKIRVGGAYKDKTRDYRGIRFYYNVNNITQHITDIYNPYFLTQPYIANGTISVNRQKQSKDSYGASHRIAAAFVEGNVQWGSMHVNVGLRFENSRQHVDYFSDGGTPRESELVSNDVFPAVNLRYAIDKQRNVRLSVSRTVTRPSFIEMSPFLYQEAYGSAQIRGNDELQNGYNYNVDVRYEHISDNGSMFAFTGYYKLLSDPIERIQQLSGGSAVHSFRNADNGTAAGVEVEGRAKLAEWLSVGANVSLMYTDVKLPEGGGAYTNTQRALQGASPYLANADITVRRRRTNGHTLTAALLYNLQGPRIDAVGIANLGDIEQQDVHSLDFNASCQFANGITAKLKLNDILHRDMRFVQDVPRTNSDLTVQQYSKGMVVQAGVSIEL